MPDKLIYISRPMDLSTMVCLMYKMPQSKESSYSPFTQTTLRCRQVIFDFPGHVLATPVTDTSNILVICPSSLQDSTKFCAKLDKLQLSLCWKMPLSTSILEDSLSYTLRARLAPAWNKVGDWLLAGRQFLHQADRIPAVQVQVHVADKRVELAITANTVTFPLLQPDDLGLDYETLKKFIEGDKNSILNVEHFEPQSVLVLPKLSKGKLVSVTKKLPEGSKFSQWSAMKRYWKNMYGYRLEVEEGVEPVVYYNVSFWAGSVLTYPEWTVRRSSPRPVPRSDPKPVLDQFIRDVQEYNKLVCGNTFKLEEKPLMPLVETVRPSQAVVSSYACARVGLDKQPMVAYRTERQEQRNHQQLWESYRINENFIKATGQTSKLTDSGYSTQLSDSQTGMLSESTSSLTAGSASKVMDDSGYSSQLCQPVSCVTACHISELQDESGYSSQASKSAASWMTASSAVKPSFNPSQAAASCNLISNSTQDFEFNKVPKPIWKKVPTFSTQSHKPQPQQSPTSQTSLKPNFKNLLANCSSLQSTFLSRLMNNPTIQAKSSGDSAPPKPDKPVPGLFSGLVMARPSTSNLTTTRPTFSSFPSTASPKVSSPSHKKPKLSPTLPALSPNKPDNTPTKKKPALQNVDIAQLVREKGASGMAKVNTATLLDYCRKEKIKSAKAKSKKDELVRMVMIHNNIPLPVAVKPATPVQ